MVKWASENDDSLKIRGDNALLRLYSYHIQGVQQVSVGFWDNIEKERNGQKWKEIDSNRMRQNGTKQIKNPI